MNRKQLLLLLVALAILGSAGLVLINQYHESWNTAGTKMGDKVLPGFNPNDVAAIRIKSDSSELNLAHNNDVWRVQERDDYPANFGRISDVLIRLQGLKVVESDTVGPSQLAHVNLEEPGNGNSGGTLVEFKDAQGKVLTALLLGKKHAREQAEASHAVVASEPDGRYILVRSDPKNVLLVPDALATLEPAPAIWLNKDFFKVERPRSIALASTNEADSWKLARENESSLWTLVDAKPGETLDTNKVHMMTNALNSATFSDVMSAKDAGGLDSPMVVTIETFDDFVYTLKMSRNAENSCQLTVTVASAIPANRVTGNNESADETKKLDREFQEKTGKLQEKFKRELALGSWVYVVNSWIIDPLTRNRAQILEGYKDEKSADTANAADSAAKKPKPGWTPRVIQ